MTKRWGSKNFGAFLDALHGDAELQAELKQRMLAQLVQSSPRTLRELAQALACTELQLHDVASQAMSEGLVDFVVTDSEQIVRLAGRAQGAGGTKLQGG